MSKHTPGPWIGAGPSFGNPLPRYTTEIVTELEDEDDGSVSICRLPFHHHDDENEANAHLIAAAPDLLEACEALVSGLKNDAFDLARAAIAKAKRRQVEWRQRGRGDEALRLLAPRVEAERLDEAQEEIAAAIRQRDEVSIQYAAAQERIKLLEEGVDLLRDISDGARAVPAGFEHHYLVEKATIDINVGCFFACLDRGYLSDAADEDVALPQCRAAIAKAKGTIK